MNGQESPHLQEDKGQQERRGKMGDKGKKDKDKGQKQKTSKQDQKAKKKDEKQPKRTLKGEPCKEVCHTRRGSMALIREGPALLAGAASAFFSFWKDSA